jgi:hypothetical protein
MSYGKTTLVARRNYSDYSDLGSDCARTAMNIEGTAIECIDANGNVISSTPTNSSGGGGFWSTIASFGQSLVGAYGAQQNAAAAQAAAAANAQNAWVMPVVVVGGLGLVALVLLKKKKQNPSRRRRRRR